MMSKSTIVIGAGIAGISCAKKLASTPGFNVTVLEASDRIGGRVRPTKFGKNSVELGAQWIHGEVGNSIFSLIRPFDILDQSNTVFPKKHGPCAIFVTQHGDFLPDNIHEKVFNVIDQVFTLIDKIQLGEEPVEHEPLGAFVTRIFQKCNEDNPLHHVEEICTGLLDWMHRFQNTVDGSGSWFYTSCLGQLEYKVCDGNSTIAWKPPASYATLIETILFDNPRSDQFELDSPIPDWIHLNKEVIKINYPGTDDPGNEVVIQCKDGTEYRAEHVVFTPSLGILKKNHLTLFNPILPSMKINAIEAIAFGTVNKIFLEFNEPWWPEGILGFNFIWDDCGKVVENWLPNPASDTLLVEDNGIPIWCRSLLGFHTMKYQPNILYTWITGPPACFMETLDDETLQNTLVKVLEKFVGGVFPVPTPIAILRSSWNSNPYTRGSYSFRSMETEDRKATAAELAEPITNSKNSPMVCFAGEATHLHYYSTVHGAHDTGLREAERLIQHAANSPQTSNDDEKRSKDSKTVAEDVCCTILNFI